MSFNGRALHLVYSEGVEAPEGYMRRGFEAACGRGRGVDLIEAHKWFNIAAAKGCREAVHHRRELSDQMSAQEVAEAQRQAREWLALQHHAPAA
ncbi:hypothetical protein [Pseudovibrio exalbescens]|nr:hypothetical protein [Pseudovibrio exalbescens]